MTSIAAPEWTRGDRMRKARVYAGIKPVEMCERLFAYGINVKKSTLSAWENDVNQPRNMDDLMQAWAEITNVPEPWLWVGITSGGLWDDAERSERHLVLIDTGSDT